jgi:hypothetical protein
MDGGSDYVKEILRLGDLGWVAARRGLHGPKSGVGIAQRGETSKLVSIGSESWGCNVNWVAGRHDGETTPRPLRLRVINPARLLERGKGESIWVILENFDAPKY